MYYIKPKPGILCMYQCILCMHANKVKFPEMDNKIEYELNWIENVL